MNAVPGGEHRAVGSVMDPQEYLELGAFGAWLYGLAAMCEETW